MKNLKTTIAVSLSAILLVGCVNPVPNAVDLNQTMVNMTSNYNMKFDIKKGDTLKLLISKMQASSENVIFIDKTKSEIVFEDDMRDVTPEELRQYIKVKTDKTISFRKFSDKLFSVDEIISKEAESKLKKALKPSFKIPEMKIKVNGDFTYEELFNTFREDGINIIVDLNKKDDKESFNIKDKAPEFTGKLSEFLDMVSSREKLFIIPEENNNIRLKDLKTVTYNLKLPKIQLATALSANGQNTAVTIAGAVGGGMMGGGMMGGGMNTGIMGGGMNTGMMGGGMNTGMMGGGMNTGMMGGGMNTGMMGGGMNTGMMGGGMNTGMMGGGMNTGMMGGGMNTGMMGGGMSEATSISPLDSFKKQMDEMLKDKAIFSINGSNGTVSITGNYEALDISNKLVDDFHDIYDHAIKIELHVYEVKIDNKDAFGIDYNFLKNEIVGGSLSNVFTATTGMVNGLTLIPTNTMSMTNTSGSLVSGAGDSAVTSAAETQGIIFKSLNKFGKTSVVTKPSLGTINNLPVKLDIIDSKDYVYSLGQSSNILGGTNGAANTVSNAITPEIRTVTTGYSLVVHPKIEGDYIKVAIKNISSTLNALTPYSFQSGTDEAPAESTIYLKDVSAREFDETVKIKEGEIAIIGGYMYERKASNKDGLPFTTEADSSLDALTSAKDYAKEKVEIVITISAKII